MNGLGEPESHHNGTNSHHESAQNECHIQTPHKHRRGGEIPRGRLYPSLKNHRHSPDTSSPCKIARREVDDPMRIPDSIRGMQTLVPQTSNRELLGERRAYSAESRPRGYANPCSARRTASSIPAALLRVSWYSRWGMESATIPAPACTKARPFLTSTIRMAMQVSRLPLNPM